MSELRLCGGGRRGGEEEEEGGALPLRRDKSTSACVRAQQRLLVLGMYYKVNFTTLSLLLTINGANVKQFFFFSFNTTAGKSDSHSPPPPPAAPAEDARLYTGYIANV